MARGVTKAEGVEIHADKIRKKPLNRESGNHEGRNRRAEKKAIIGITVHSSKEGASDTPSGELDGKTAADMCGDPMTPDEIGNIIEDLREERICIIRCDECSSLYQALYTNQTEPLCGINADKQR